MANHNGNQNPATSRDISEVHLLVTVIDVKTLMFLHEAIVM